MKVALVNYQFSAVAGGVERYVFDLTQGLLARGHEVHVYCHRRDSHARERLQFHTVPAWRFYSPLRTWSYARNAAEMIRRDRGSYDVVHGFGRTLEQDIYRVGGGCHLAYLEATEPAMRTRWGRARTLMNPRHRLALALEARLFRERRFQRLTCISHEVARQVTAQYGIPPSELQVIHNGVNIEKFSPELRPMYRRGLRESFSIPDSTFVALFVGSGFERKGLLHAIRAAAMLPRSLDWRLVVVGNGRHAHYRSIAEEGKVGDRVLLVGARSDVERFYGAADALLFPTLFEPFGTVALEAMATGIPVITSRVAGCSEVIADGVDSYVVEDPRAEGELADRLRRLTDPAHREEMGRAARAKALEYGIDRNIDATLRLYEEVRALGAQRGPATKAPGRL